MDFHATVLQQTGDERNDRSRRSHGTPYHPQQASPGQRAFAHAAAADSPPPGFSSAPGPPRHSSFVEGVMNEVGGAAIETERAGRRVGSASRHSTNADGGSGAGGASSAGFGVGAGAGGFPGHVGAIGDEALAWKAVGPKDANANELNTTNTANANVTVVRSPTKASTQQLLLQSDFHQPAPFHPQQHRPHPSPSSSSPTTNSFPIPTHHQLPLHPANAAPLISTPSSSASATITTRRPPPLLNHSDHHPPPPQHSFDPYASSHLPSTISSTSSPPYPTYNPGLPPLAPPPGASGSSISMASPGAKNGASPLQPPQDDRHQTTAREKKSGSFYDPLTDTTTKERRPSDSWSNNKQVS
ncbi:DNA helicase ino80 [Apiospora rasikravindrae]|uniref:DNA helicase ino80 n=1 Tax=Apiospora rasikravindrae TaxID=990691 RepID=A0ABR1RRT9_9PEZI